MSIKKIAEITGTSPATVSRVLNNPSYKCAVPGLRDKIWRAAMDFFYPEYVIETYQTEKEGFQTMQKFLKLKEPPTGCLSALSFQEASPAIISLYKSLPSFLFCYACFVKYNFTFIVCSLYSSSILP